MGEDDGPSGRLLYLEQRGHRVAAFMAAPAALGAAFLGLLFFLAMRPGAVVLGLLLMGLAAFFGKVTYMGWNSHGQLLYVFQADEKTLRWGPTGVEHEVPLSDIVEAHHDDMAADTTNAYLTLSGGQFVGIGAIPFSRHGELFEFLRDHIDGDVYYRGRKLKRDSRRPAAGEA